MNATCFAFASQGSKTVELQPTDQPLTHDDAPLIVVPRGYELTFTILVGFSTGAYEGLLLQLMRCTDPTHSAGQFSTDL